MTPTIPLPHPRIAFAFPPAVVTASGPALHMATRSVLPRQFVPMAGAVGNGGASRGRPADAVETLRLPSVASLFVGKLAPLALIANEDVQVRASLRRVLENTGYRVEEAGRGMQALAIRVHNPSLVLLDIDISGPNGLECLLEIRNRRAGMKVIILSAELTQEDLEDANIGAFEFLPKPVDPRRLAAAVRRAITEYAAADEDTGLASI